MKDHRIYVRVADAERQLFRDLAEYYGEDMSTVLRRMVRMHHQELVEAGKLTPATKPKRKR